MKLRNKNILLISPECWNHIFVSKHHYATHLAKRSNRVIFLNPPTSNWKVVDSEYENLKIIDYPGFWKGLYLLPRFLRTINQKKIFAHIEKLSGSKIDIIWSFDNSVFFDLDALPSSVLKISHIVDLNMDFQFKKASSSADICLAVSKMILNKQKSHNDRSYLINHGYNPQTSEKLALPSLGSVKIGYAGNLDIKYIDWEIIEEVVLEFNDVDFFFAGSGKLPMTLKNAHFLGKLSSGKLSSFYNQMDILIIAYKADLFHEQLANPHKIMEYLASGKPIVATYTKEYEDKDLLYMSVDNNKWPGLLKKVVQNLPMYSSNELMVKRKAYALDNTYEKQIDRIEQILIDNG